jgi:hypothetical protein
VSELDTGALGFGRKNCNYTPDFKIKLTKYEIPSVMKLSAGQKQMVNSFNKKFGKFNACDSQSNMTEDRRYSSRCESAGCECRRVFIKARHYTKTNNSATIFTRNQIGYSKILIVSHINETIWTIKPKFVSL